MRHSNLSKIKTMSEPAACRYAREIVSRRLDDAWDAESATDPRERVLAILAARIKAESDCKL